MRTLLSSSGFAHGRSATSPDSEQFEHTMPLGIIANLCERGANSRQARLPLIKEDYNNIVLFNFLQKDRDENSF